MQKCFNLFWLFCLWILTTPLTCSIVAATVKRPNFLFLLGESIRPDTLEAYGGSELISPILNALSKRTGSLVIEQAHVNHPLCNPSRTSILLGLSPETSGVKTNYMDWKQNKNSTSWRSLPRLLRDNNYYTMSGGKIFHKKSNDPTAWNLIFNNDDLITTTDCAKDKRRIPIPIGGNSFLPLVMGCKTTSNSIVDFRIASSAVKALQGLSKHKEPKPFLLAVGFHQPHFPCHVHERFWLSLGTAETNIPLVEPTRNYLDFQNDFTFESPKPIGPSGLMGDADPYRSEIPDSLRGGTVFGEQGEGPSLNFRMALKSLYFSSMRQTDYCIGQILDTIRNLGYENNTLVLFLSDHSYALGETRLFEKDIPIDIATRVPLIFHIPWATFPPAKTSPAFLMETLDIYRTVTGLLKISTNHLLLEGIDHSDSFMTSQDGKSTVALSQVIRCTDYSSCYYNLKGMDRIGFSARSKNFRYIAWIEAKNGIISDWSSITVHAEELYSHLDDNNTLFAIPPRYETLEFTNIATKMPEMCNNYRKFIVNRFNIRNPSSTLPSMSPSQVPSSLPSISPIPSQSVAPSNTFYPTKLPTPIPSSISPTPRPTTLAPTTKPTLEPTMLPTIKPTQIPSNNPSVSPVTSQPSKNPTSQAPTTNPSTQHPTGNPSTQYPTRNPITHFPTKSPSSPPRSRLASPTLIPTIQTNTPTGNSSKPTFTPTDSFFPSVTPSKATPPSPVARPGRRQQTSFPTRSLVPRTIAPSKNRSNQETSAPSNQALQFNDPTNVNSSSSFAYFALLAILPIVIFLMISLVRYYRKNKSKTEADKIKESPKNETMMEEEKPKPDITEIILL